MEKTAARNSNSTIFSSALETLFYNTVFVSGHLHVLERSTMNKSNNDTF